MPNSTIETFENFKAFFPGFPSSVLKSLWKLAQQSPEFLYLLQQGQTITLGPSGGGTYTLGRVITIDSDDLNQPAAQLLITLAHELGHGDDPDGHGKPASSAATDIASAVKIGETNEAVAMMYEYIVSTQASSVSQPVSMRTDVPDSYIDALNNAAKTSGFNISNFAGLVPANDFRTTAINLGMPIAAKLSPSSATHLNYESQSADFWIFWKLGVNNVDYLTQANKFPVLAGNVYSINNWSMNITNGAKLTPQNPTPTIIQVDSLSAQINTSGAFLWEYLTQTPVGKSQPSQVTISGTQPINSTGPIAAINISNVSVVQVQTFPSSNTTAVINGNNDAIYEKGNNNSITLNGSSTDQLYFGIPGESTGDDSVNDSLSWTATGDCTVSNNGTMLAWTNNSIAEAPTYTFTYGQNKSPVGTLVITSTLRNDSFTINGFNIDTAIGTGVDGIKLTQSATMSVGNTSATSPTTNVSHAVDTNALNSSPLAAANGSTTTSNTVVPISISDLITSADSTNVVLSATGNTSGLYVDEGSTLVSLASGSVTLSIAAGASNVIFGLVDQNPSTQNQTVTLSATVADSGNPDDTSTTNSETVTFNGITTPPAATVINSVTGTLPNDPTANASIVPATFYQLNDNNDVVTAGSGSNIIADGILGYSAGNAGGTNFSIGNGMVSSPNGYAGAIWAFAAGNDTISGGGGQGVIAVGNGNNQIFAGSATSLSTALTQVQSATASNTNGYYITVGDGKNTIVGGGLVMTTLKSVKETTPSLLVLERIRLSAAWKSKRTI